MTDVRWPGGRRIAVVVNIMYEQWSPGAAPGLGPMGNPLPRGAVDHQAISWSAYGWRTGVWRLLDVLADNGTHGSFFPSGILAETSPESLRAIAGAGHEICGHGWAQDLVPAMLDQDEEQRQIAASTLALEAASGQRPRGWISPRCTPSASTAELLAAEGYQWFGDVFDTDLPYELDTDPCPVLAIPFGMEVNDFPLQIRYGNPSRELSATFLDVLAAQAAGGETALIDVTLHAHVSGRPPGAVELNRILGAARDADVWTATRGEVATHWRSTVRGN